jgi:nitroreductase
MQPWHAIGELARLAPSPHNTQPYRIRPLADGSAELVLVCDRLLPAEDAGNAYVLSAFGMFAATLEHAGRAHGFAVTVAAVPSIDGAALHRRSGDVVVGRATLAPTPRDPDARALLQLRRTSRLPYHDRTIAPATLAWFAQIVAQAGHAWSACAEPARIARLLRRNARAIVDNLQDPDECEELRRWHRLGRSPTYGDGLWQAPMQQPAWQLRAAFAVPWLFAVEPVKTLALARYLHGQHTRHVAAIAGPFATWPDQIAAGRLLVELWLAMAEAGVYMQPFGSLLTHPAHAAWVAEEFGVAPWLVLRMGYSDPPPAAPRLESIVVASRGCSS